MMEAVLVLATIAQRYRLRLEPGFEATPWTGITLRPKYGVRVTLEARAAPTVTNPSALAGAV